MTLLRTNPAIRIRPPSDLTHNKWQVEDFNARKIFSVPQIAVALLLYSMKPRCLEDIIQDATNTYNLSEDDINKLIGNLNQKNLLIGNEDIFENEPCNSELFTDAYSRWKEHHWGAAAEYHFFTFDYPFLNYSDNADGRQVTNQRMHDYSEIAPDINRIKTYPENFKRISLPWLLNDSLTDINDDQEVFEIKKTLGIADISICTAIAFAKMTQVNIRWKGTPLIRRTSPSGGSRHPTEGYIMVFDVEGIDNGVYHIQSSPFCLVKLAANAPLNLSNIFYELSSDSKESPAAIIVLTSIFERNMYRYREPRTFRTIHMDAGHILGTIELIANHIAIKTKIMHQFDEAFVEKLMGLDGLIEGAITSIGLFHSEDITP